MNVLVSVNDEYLKYLKTTIFSLCINVKEHINVYFLNASINEKTIEELRMYLHKKCRGATLFDFKIATEELKPLANQNMHFNSVETFARLMAQFVLPSTVDRVLWLDADIIIRKDISNFYYQDFEEKYFVACPSYDCCDDVKKKIGLPIEATYFNAGVLLLNLDALRKNTTVEQVLNVCDLLKDKWVYLDQDVLNTLYLGKVKFDNRELYNFEVMGMRYIPIRKWCKIYILHYTTRKKPWIPQYVRMTSYNFLMALWKQGNKKEVLKIMQNVLHYWIANHGKSEF